MNKVLVLMAVYNGKPWLQMQISSILSQEGVGVELLIGDDCSADGALHELIAEKPDERLQVLQFEKPSGGAGKNFIRILAEADIDQYGYVAFSDQDDEWNSDKLARAVESLELNYADAYSSSVVAFWPDGKEKILHQNSNQTDIDYLFEGAGQGCTFVLRCDFAKQVQVFIRDHCEQLSDLHYHDWLVYALSRVMRKKWVFDPIPSMRYRQHGGNDTGARGAASGISKRLSLIRSGWYANQVNQILNSIFRVVESDSVIPSDFLNVWNAPATVSRRINLALLLFRRGRRRASDRIVLAISSLMGWL